MATRAGIPCPDCRGKEKTKYMALFANKEGQRYAVGKTCYRKQWAKKYGRNKPCPI